QSLRESTQLSRAPSTSTAAFNLPPPTTKSLLRKLIGKRINNGRVKSRSQPSQHCYSPGFLFPSGAYDSDVVAPEVTVVGTLAPAADMTSFNAAIVSNDGLKLPGRYPSAIRSGVQPRLFGVFHVSIFAPFSARKWTTFGKLLYAAPCIAVSRFLSVTFTSACNVRRYFTSSTHSASVPASSSGA